MNINIVMPYRKTITKNYIITSNKPVFKKYTLDMLS